MPDELRVGWRYPRRSRKGWVSIVGKRDEALRPMIGDDGQKYQTSGHFMDPGQGFSKFDLDVSCGFSVACEPKDPASVDAFAREQGLNPKDLVGSTKVDLSLVPPAGEIACALAMQDGARKYGPYNWREPGKPVQARTYVAAAIRHWKAWLDGEECAQDSGVHHLGHAMACGAILLDAIATGQLADNRPAKGAAARLLKEGEEITKKMGAKK